MVTQAPPAPVVDKETQDQHLAALYKGLSSVKYNENHTVREGLKAQIRVKIEQH